MYVLFENWRNFINEVTEEEMSNLDDILHNLSPEDLSFNNIFGDRMRTIEPMKIKDKMFDTFKKVLKASGYEPDFTTGLATYHTFNIGGVNPKGERNKPIILTPEQKKHMMDDDGVPTRFDTDTDEDFEKRKKLFQKKQIKIGKLLQKAARLYNNAHIAWNEAQKLNPEDFGVSPDWSPGDADDLAKVEKYREAAQEAQKKERKELQKLFDSFQAYKSSASATYNVWKELADWWNKKSTFYRENPDEASVVDSPYSIVYTRHPIDVMRMSDFDNIESCHSPPSRESGAGQSYYKCAVAEAHGHGPVAYVVRNEDLQEMKDEYGLQGITDQELLDAIEENDEELFQDNMRAGGGNIAPLSRVRLKKFVNPGMEISLAVPSTMTYGKKFPALYQNISRFVKEKQAKELKVIRDSVETIGDPENGIFNEEGFFDLGNWERFGGSYQDAGDYPADVFHKWLGYTVTGRTRYDVGTEAGLDIRGDVREEWQQEVNEIRDRFNNRYQAARIDSAAVEDDGGGEYYIEVSAVFRIVLDENDFVVSAFQDSVRKAIDYIPSELQEMGYDELGDHVHYTTINPRSQDWADLIQSAAETSESKVVIEIPIKVEEVDPNGGGYAYNPGHFEEIADAIDTLDDKADGITSLIQGYLKREGILEGGALIELSRALEDESWYEWDYIVDDDWAPENIELETTTYVPFADLISQIPITFERRAPDSGEVFINFAGDPLAMASQTHGGEDFSFKGWEVRSPEFEADRLGGFKDMDEVKEYVQDQVAKMILRPKSSTRIPKGWQASRDYMIAVSNLMRQATGIKEGEFAYPNRSMWTNGPDSDDEYRMMFVMELQDGDGDEVVKNAHKIIAETDDEDQLKEIFRNAFITVAKISLTSAPAASILSESRKKRKGYKIKIFKRGHVR